MKHSQLVIQEQPTIFSEKDFPESKSINVGLIALVGSRGKLKCSAEKYTKKQYSVDTYVFEGQEYKLVKYEMDKNCDIACDFEFTFNQEPLCYFISVDSPFVTLSKTDLERINYQNPIFMSSTYNSSVCIGMVYKKEDFNQEQFVTSMSYTCVYYNDIYRKRILEQPFEFCLELDNTDFFTQKRLNETFLESDRQKAKTYLTMNYNYNNCKYTDIYKRNMSSRIIDGVIEDPQRTKTNKLYYVDTNRGITFDKSV